MEVSGTVLRHVTYVSGAATHAHSRGVVPRVGVRVSARPCRARVVMDSGFCDDGHVKYYQDTKKGQPVLTTKKKLKLLKDLSKSVSLFPQLGECDEVVDMNSFRAGVAVAPAPVVELQPPALQATMLSPPALLPKTTSVGADAMELFSTNDVSVNSVSVGFKNESTVVATAPQKRIEVCMGNKCKRSGAAALLQEFERVVGAEGGAVVGCKCMGKCKSGPNVRIQNSVDHDLAEGLNDSVKIPANPLCIGVGLEDVDTIVGRFLGENHNHNDMGMAAAAT
ncbi:Thioredoxin-like superfamily [Sesbania bispinosa]|nr:Thioredoxin-like superfamily [Sesbania bispinosa]